MKVFSDVETATVTVAKSVSIMVAEFGKVGGIVGRSHISSVGSNFIGSMYAVTKSCGNGVR